MKKKGTVDPKASTSSQFPQQSTNQSQRSLIPDNSSPSGANWDLEALEPKVLMSGDLAPGVQIIEGSIDQPGEQDTFEFVVTETNTQFFFDGTQGANMQWSLQGPTQSSSFTSRGLTASGDHSVILPIGTYRLTVDGENNTIGNYSFRLIGADGALNVTPNTLVTGVFEAGHQAELYKIELTAGDNIFLQGGSNIAGAGWSLFDPQAKLLINNQSLNIDQGPLTVERTGTYWLSLERNEAASNTLPYSFTVFRQATQHFPLIINQAVTTSLKVPGAVVEYSFAITQDGFIDPYH